MGGEEERAEKGRACCDFCGEARGVVYCRADGAGLCLRCDRHVHSANTVSYSHPRAPLCDACRAAPAAFLCAAHQLLLCPNCDFDAHQSPGQEEAHHDRRAVEPYSGCPTAAELGTLLGVGEDDKSVMGCGDGNRLGWAAGDEGWLWETPPHIVRWDDLIVPTTDCHGFQAIGVPPLPKQKRNSACGKHREEILQQLHELMKSEADVSNDCGELEPFIEFQSLEPQQNAQVGNLGSDFIQDTRFASMATYEVNMLHWNQSDCHEATDPVVCPYEQFTGSSVTMETPFINETADIQVTESHASDGDKNPGHPFKGGHNWSLLFKGGPDIVCPDRDTVLSRYKEKRKTRRYNKLIRYESRKARADSRVRIKGRFAKASQVVKS